jgi:hypothetical protein
LSVNEDLGILISFLDNLKIILERFISEDYLDEVVSLHDTGKEDFRNEYVKLLPIFRKSFPGVKRAILISINKLLEPNPELLSKLDEHGLRGGLLTLEIDIANIHKKYLLDEMKEYETKYKTNPNKNSFLKKIARSFIGFLKPADIPLESLASCIPGLGMVVEFKKTVEHFTDKFVSDKT